MGIEYRAGRRYLGVAVFLILGRVKPGILGREMGSEYRAGRRAPGVAVLLMLG